MEDRINHPKHYTKGIECADYIESWDMNFFQGNAVKYLTRYPYKGAPVEDLKKARWYIDRILSSIEEKVEVIAPGQIAVTRNGETKVYGNQKEKDAS